jgi:hypothetical protein
MVRRQTIILLVLLAALIGVTLLLRRNPPAASARQTPSATAQPALLAGWKADDIVQIQYQDAQGSDSVTRNAVSGWTHAGEPQATAEPGSMEQVAAQLADLTVLESLPAESDLSIFGLADPASVLTVTNRQGQAVTLRVGSLTPTKRGYYIQAGDPQAVLIVAKDSVEAILQAFQKAQPTPALTATP